jgi:hypothetical protein
MHRRDFLKTAAALPALAEGAPSPSRPALCIFSKHMAQFDWQGLAENARRVGFDGVDLTVRPGGHVLPERVAEDLPRAVKPSGGRG